MIHLLILAVHLLSTIAKLARQRAPNLNSFDRFILALGSLLVPASRIPKLAVILKPRTLLRFHETLKKRKYRRLFSSGGHQRPRPKGPSKELIVAIVDSGSTHEHGRSAILTVALLRYHAHPTIDCVGTGIAAD